jgi:hypothetical protein
VSNGEGYTMRSFGNITNGPMMLPKRASDERQENVYRSARCTFFNLSCAILLFVLRHYRDHGSTKRRDRLAYIGNARSYRTLRHGV